MANKVGKLIKEARTAAGMTQEQLAKKVKGVSSNDISKAERGELKLTQDNLKDIAKATGVTQKSLLDAASSSTYKSSTSTKSSAKSSSKSSSSKSSSSAAKTSMKVTSTEKKLVELYREADTATRKQVMKTLKGTDDDNSILEALLGGDALSSLLGSSSSKSSKKSDASELLTALLGGLSK